MSEDERDERHGRLGRLFAALVGTETDAPETGGGGPGADEAEPAATSRLDLEELSRQLANSTNPLLALRRLVDDVRARTASAEAGDAPSALETHLAERLQEAGLSDSDSRETPAVRVVRPRTSGLFYLRIDEDELSYAAKLRVLRIEAALNGALLATQALEDPEAASCEDLVRLEARCARSIVAQAAELAGRREGPARGEWDVRQALSEAIESARVPYRLTARFRVNALGRRAAFEIDLVPPRIWAATTYVDGLGIVSSTTEMRRRAASDYNLRLGVLLAGYALLVAPELEEVWVAGRRRRARSPRLLLLRATHALAARGSRPRGALDVWALMRAAGATMDEQNLALAPVRQGFSLDDEALCPARRWDVTELSEEGAHAGARTRAGRRERA